MALAFFTYRRAAVAASSPSPPACFSAPSAYPSSMSPPYFSFKLDRYQLSVGCSRAEIKIVLILSGVNNFNCL